MEVSLSSHYRPAVYDIYTRETDSFSYMAGRCLDQLNETGTLWKNYVKKQGSLSPDCVQRKFLIERINSLVDTILVDARIDSDKSNLKDFLYYKCFKDKFKSVEGFIERGTAEDTKNAGLTIKKFLTKVQEKRFLSLEEKQNKSRASTTRISGKEGVSLELDSISSGRKYIFQACKTEAFTKRLEQTLIMLQELSFKETLFDNGTLYYDASQHQFVNVPIMGMRSWDYCVRDFLISLIRNLVLLSNENEKPHIKKFLLSKCFTIEKFATEELFIENGKPVDMANAVQAITIFFQKIVDKKLISFEEKQQKKTKKNSPEFQIEKYKKELLDLDEQIINKNQEIINKINKLKIPSKDQLENILKEIKSKKLVNPESLEQKQRVEVVLQQLLNALYPINFDSLRRIDFYILNDPKNNNWIPKTVQNLDNMCDEAGFTGLNRLENEYAQLIQAKNSLLDKMKGSSASEPSPLPQALSIPKKESTDSPKIPPSLPKSKTISPMEPFTSSVNNDTEVVNDMISTTSDNTIKPKPQSIDSSNTTIEPTNDVQNTQTDSKSIQIPQDASSEASTTNQSEPNIFIRFFQAIGDAFNSFFDWLAGIWARLLGK